MMATPPDPDAAGKPGIAYRYRSEFAFDETELLRLLPKGEIIEHGSAKFRRRRGAECRLRLKSLKLEELRTIMRKVPDAHVMIQTLQHEALYTGVRNFDL
jgi:hypothetical protein